MGLLLSLVVPLAIFSPDSIRGKRGFFFEDLYSNGKRNTRIRLVILQCS